MKFLKFTCGAVVVAITGFVAGSFLFTLGFYSLWWSFPSSWQPLSDLPEAPQQLLALKAEEAIYLLRTANGALYTCHAASCASEHIDWSTPNTRCDDSTRPGSISLFPYLVSRAIQVNLACERSYQDIGRTVYVVSTSSGVTWYSTGLSLLPTDAGVVGMGLLGGLGGMALSLLAGGIIFLVRRGRRRRAEARADNNV
jgi:hypothetical protein